MESLFSVKFTRSLLIVFLSLSHFASGCAHKPNLWLKVHEPKAGPPKIHGTVNAGCIAGAQELAGADLKAELMRPSRNRFYGHPKMIHYLVALTSTLYASERKYLLIGDIAQPRGGPTGVPGQRASHSSHQTGIDVDIWYRTGNSKLTPTERESLNAFDLVASDNETMTKHWNARFYRTLLKMAASHSDVDRIFVNPAIKRELCIDSRKHREANTDWLRKIRPWWAHSDHFHVRLLCPDDDIGCTPSGDPIPPGDGCDETLNWWFSAEAKDMLIEKAARPDEFRMPELPRECDSLLELPL